MTELTKEQASEYFAYNAETGTLSFKERGKETFSNKALYAQHLKRIGKIAGKTNAEGYRQVRVGHKTYSEHRIAWLLTYGYLPKFPEFEIDHINGNRSDNRISNLRVVTRSQNQRNAGIPVTNKSGVRGVFWDKVNKKWKASIRNGIKPIHLGSFSTRDEACHARKEAEKAYGFIGQDRPSFALSNNMEARS